MKTSPPSTQHGQALVLVALAAVGLFAFAALAIDGSIVFSDRRHAQNASDTSALAAALALTRDANPGLHNWKQAGYERAASNGYDKDDGATEVYVHLCNDTSIYTSDGLPVACQGLPTDADPSEYVHVYIRSVVKLFFARVIGWQQVINHTDAVVRATPPKIVPWYKGNAIVSTMMTCKNEAGWPKDPFDVSGNSSTTVISSGILVNAKCDPAYEQGGSSEVTTTKGVCVAGSADSTHTFPVPTEGCEQIDPNQYMLPQAPDCSEDGYITEVSPKVYVAEPGNYDDPFPNKSPAGTLTLKRGIYCLQDGIDLNSTWSITTDLDGDGPDSDEGVFFYVPHGTVTFNGTSDIDIHAISAPFAGFDSRYLNYLMYLPPTNTETIKITGSDSSNFTGTILAPASHVVLSGGSTTSGGETDGAVTLDAQIISFTTAITGDGTLNILYTQSKNGVTSTKPTLSQTE